MTDELKNTRLVDRARRLRRVQTKSEGLLWSLLRASQLSGLKFRREHPIDPYIVDFACLSEKLVVEIDGGCHDLKGESDLRRQAYLERLNWKVLRFTDKDVEEDAEAVAKAIAEKVGREYVARKRSIGRSGMRR